MIFTIFAALVSDNDPPKTVKSQGSTGTTDTSAPAPAPVPADSGVAPIAGPAGNGFVYIGSVAGGYDRAVQGTGVDLANHTYSFFTGNVPNAEMLTVSAASTNDNAAIRISRATPTQTSGSLRNSPMSSTRAS